MEHLPDTKVQSLNIQVPYVVIEDIHAYNGELLTFSQFRQFHHFDELTIERQGWNAYARPSPGGGQIEAQRVVESFLQEWLFFGLLYEVLREDFKKKKDFIFKNQVGRWMITTSGLPSLLWSYKQRWTSMNRDQQYQRSTQAKICLYEASEFVNKFLGSESLRQADIPLDEDIILSITIIVGTLAAAVAEVCKVPRLIVTRPEHVDRLLLSHHWCPTTLSMLERRGFRPQGMCYAVMLGPLPSSRNHSSCSKKDFGCKANTVDRDSYQTSHSPACVSEDHTAELNCPFEYIDHDQLCTVIGLAQGHPVVTVPNESVSDFRLDMQQSSPHQPYAAISHVWADGLGNNNGNALPRCQLQRLQRLVNCLYGVAERKPIPFWIDTLCVPKWPQESLAKAINKMAAIYQDADKILVLDANLFANPLASCQTNQTEILMRIMSTNWIRRLWTLQEGVLGKSLYFAFFDGVVDIQNIVSLLQTHLLMESSSVSRPMDSQLYPGQSISRAALEQYTSLRNLREKQEEDRLAAMWNNMHWRSTSWVGDETICMAIILRFHPDEIGTLQKVDIVYIDPATEPQEKASLEALQSVQLAARYKRFLQLLSLHNIRIPRGLVFTRGDKFDETGLRWAPSSFFRTAATGTILEEKPVGEVTDEGLLFNAPGFELYLPPTPFKSRFVMFDQSTSTFFDVDYATPIIDNKVEWKDLALEMIQDPAIILPENIPNGPIGALGLLVSITRRVEHILYATYLGRVFIRQLPADMMNWPALESLKGEILPNEMKAGLMTRLWNRRPGAPQPPGSPWVTPHEILDNMPRRWHKDGAALNYELDGIFSSSRGFPLSQKWCIG